MEIFYCCTPNALSPASDFASGSAEGGVGRFPDKFRTAPPPPWQLRFSFIGVLLARGCVVAREFGISSASSAV